MCYVRVMCVRVMCVVCVMRVCCACVLCVLCVCYVGFMLLRVSVNRCLRVYGLVRVLCVHEGMRA